jgi:signal transduction histidine kinase
MNVESPGRQTRTDPARELLWTVCHDFGNQLALVRLLTQGLLARFIRGDHPPEGDWAAALAQIDHIALAGVDLMDDVLRIEHDEVQRTAAGARPGLVDFEEALEHVLNVNEQVLAQAGCPVLVSHDGGPHRSRGQWHRGAVERLLSNLLQNVARHAPGAPVRIHLSRSKPGWLHVRFADGGRGLPEASPDLGREAFLEPVGSAGHHGLGLWIIHRSVAALEGEIEMRNAPGSGLVFDIRLPIRA